MNRLKFLREERNLTQGELASKSGLSLRTIQRIESGNTPKGFTLNAITEALNISSKDLFFSHEVKNSVSRAKLINFSALLGLIIPYGGIIFPMILTYKTKDQENKELGKSIICIQIILAVLLSIFLIICPFIQKAMQIKFPLFMIPLLSFIILKISVILINGISLNKNNNLAIKLKTNFL